MKNLRVFIAFSEFGHYHELKGFSFVPRIGDIISIPDFFETKYFNQNQWDFINNKDWIVFSVVWCKDKNGFYVEMLLK
jgi:hypothetical protein